MKCRRCGKELRVVSEEIGIGMKGIPIRHQIGYCDNCKSRFDLDAINNINIPQNTPNVINNTHNMPKETTILWDILIGLLLLIIPLAPIGIILMWVKKIPISSVTRILVTILFGLFFVVYISKVSINNIPKNNIKENITLEENKEVMRSEKEILFNDISWGISFAEADEKFGTWKLWNLSGETYKTCSVDEILIDDYKGIDFDYGGINVISNAFNGEQEVAGYTTKEIRLYFSYIPINGYLTYDEKDTALYGAQYKFEPVNLQDTYNDLKQKLMNIYGEPSKVTEDSDMWGNKYIYTYWYGQNDTELVLRSLNSENDTTNLYSDEIYITYAWREGDALLQNASDAIKKEKLDKEKDAQKNENIDKL